VNSKERCEQFAPDRGDGHYTQFTDLNGAQVRLVHSTLASREAVRLFVYPPWTPQMQEALRLVEMLNPVLAMELEEQLRSVGAHLCKAMAREVAAELGVFLDDRKGLACQQPWEEEQ